FALNGAHEPDAPTTWPLSLIANAFPSGSPPNVGRRWILPLRHTTGSNWPTGQFDSWLPFSANPATSPRLLIWLATAFAPPRVGSDLITPFCHTNGRHALAE